MIYGLYQSAAGMMVNEYRQGVTANNLANADTVGFKRDIAVFSERPPAWEGAGGGASKPGLDPLTGGVWLGRTQTDFSPGSLVPTQQPTDVSLDGPGFFLVQKGGQTYATRDGRFITDPLGNLLAAEDGAAVLGVGGLPIRLNPNVPLNLLSFDQRGRVLQGGRPTGILGVVDFEDYSQLRKVSGSRFAVGSAKPVPSAAIVNSGGVEASGVEPVKELVGMIESARAYQFNAQLVSMQDQSIGRLISTLANT